MTRFEYDEETSEQLHMDVIYRSTTRLRRRLDGWTPCAGSTQLTNFLAHRIWPFAKIAEHQWRSTWTARCYTERHRP
jgi:hypothetical protein